MGKSIMVLPSLISAHDVVVIPEEVMEKITLISSRTIETHVSNFIKKVNNDPNADEECREAAKKLDEAYNSYRKRQEFINSERMSQTVKMILGTNAQDLNYNMSTEHIDDLRNRFTEVLNSEEMIQKRDKDNVMRIIGEIADIALQYDLNSEEYIVISGLAVRMKKMSGIFIDNSAITVSRSKLETALKFKDKIQSLLLTIDNVQEVQSLGRDGVNPRTWRQL